MGDLTLRINADVDRAQRAFEDLANSSEELRKEMEEYAKSITKVEIDKFTENQKRLRTALTGTRGETAALQQSVNAYGRQMEMLVKRGMSPTSDAIVRLRDEQEALRKKIEEANEAKKNQTKLLEGMEKAALAGFAALAAGVATLVAFTEATARAGDEIAKTARMFGMTAETLQELRYAADQSGVQNLDYSLRRLTQGMIEVRSGTGRLTAFLQNNNRALLNQLQRVNSNEEALSLLMDALTLTTDEYQKAALAMAAFGQRGIEMVNMAQNGAEGLNELREAARRHGLITNEAAEMAEHYMSVQTDLRYALKGVRNELGEALMPVLINVMEAATNFINSVDDWPGLFQRIGRTILVASSGVTAFVIATRAHATVGKMKKAVEKLRAVFTKNWKGLIIGGAVAGITALVGHFRGVNREAELARFSIERFNRTPVRPNVPNNNVNNLSVNPAVEQAMRDLNELNRLRFQIHEMTYAMENRVQRTLNVQDQFGHSHFLNFWADHAYEQSRAQAEILTNRFLIQIDNLRNAINIRLSSLPEELSDTPELFRELYTIDIPAVEIPAEINVEPQINWPYIDLQRRLNHENYGIVKHDTQTANERLNILRRFLQQRAELYAQEYGKQYGDREEAQKAQLRAQIRFLENYGQTFKEHSYLLGEERTLMEQAVLEKIRSLRDEHEQIETERITRMRQKEYEARKSYRKEALEQKKLDIEIARARGDAYMKMFGGILQIMKMFEGQNREMFMFLRSLALAEVAVNTARAITRALAEGGPPPFNKFQAMKIGAMGAAQKAGIVSAMISAETGGRFIVPNSARGVDSGLMRVNPGEEIDVTPRGMTGMNDMPNAFNLVIDNQVLANVINTMAINGELHGVQRAVNL